MKNETINIDNFEAFLLDKIEGNLRPELEAELDAFMAAHNIGDVTADDLFYINEAPSEANVTEMCLFSEDLKHFEPSSEEEMLLFEAVEGTISPENETRLREWMSRDEIVRRHFDAMAATKITADDTITFPHKASLKKSIPIRRMLYALAAACLIGMLFTFGFLRENGSLTGPSEIASVAIPANADPNTNRYADQVTVGGDTEVSLPASRDRLSASAGTGQSPDPNRKARKMAGGNIRKMLPSTMHEEGRSVEEIAGADDQQSKKVSSDRMVPPLPKIARLGTSGVTSREPVNAVANIFQKKATADEDMADAFNIRETLEYLDRKSSAIYGFADYQKNIIKSEGLFGLSKERNQEGKVEGYALRIAGFEISTVK